MCCDARYLGAPCECNKLMGPWELAARSARRREQAGYLLGSTPACSTSPNELGLYYVKDGKRLASPAALRVGA
jgi:hypothetical protein